MDQVLINAVIASMSCGVAMVRVDDGTILYANRRFAELFGYEASELRGRTITSVNAGHPDDKQRISAQIVATLRREGVWRGDLLNERKDGTQVWTHASIVRVNHDKFGEVAIGVQEDISSVRQAEAELRIKESAIAASINGIALADLEGRLTYVNAAFLRLWRQAGNQEVLGRHLTEFWVDRGSAKAIFDTTRTSGGWFGELTALRPDATHFEVQLSATLIRDARNQPEYLMVSCVDVSARVRAEAERVASESKFRAIFESEPCWVTVLHRQGTVLEINPGGRAMIEAPLGYQVCGESVLRFVAPEYHERFLAGIREALGGRRNRQEFELISMRNRRLWVEQFVVAFPHEADRDGPQQVLAVVRDITERKRMERQLSETVERLAIAQRLAQLGNWSWHLASDEITWSDEVFRIFGYEPQSLKPRYKLEFLQAVHPEDRHRVTTAVTAALASGEAYAIEHRILRADGIERIVRERGQVTFDERKQPIRMDGTVQDITEAVLAERQMQEMQDQLAHASRVATMGEMAAGIAHELNQPLGALKLYADGCLAAAAQEPFERTLLSTQLAEISQLTAHCGEIIRRLRQYSAKRVSKRSTCDARELVKTVASFMDHALRMAGIECHLHLPDEPVWLNVDSVQLQQVLINLLRNAIDVQLDSQSERRIDVKVRSLETAQVEFSVCDSGPGIPAAVVERLFEPFFTTKPTGLGMGLKVCRTIVQSHGGQIDYHATAGTGTTFVVTLPAGQGTRP